MSQRDHLRLIIPFQAQRPPHGLVGSAVQEGEVAEERFTAVRWDFCKPAKPGAEFETAAVCDCLELRKGG